MPSKFVEQAKDQMGAIEDLLKGLPGISGYVDKELRRDADKRLRDLISQQLEEQKERLLGIQKKLLKGGGLKWLDDVDEAVQKMQNLSDRVRTASYGYAGLFDAVRVQEDQLDALHRFDVAPAEQVAAVGDTVNALEAALGNNETLGTIIGHLTESVAELNRLFDKRREAILSPDLLTDTSFVPSFGDE